jgi:hypothetical protein
MKCRNCSKDIPDGFTDCPWCGEPQPAAASGASTLVSDLVARSVAKPAAQPATESLRPAGNVVFAWVSCAISLVLAIFAAYAATLHRNGFLALQDSGYFIGACVGPFVISAMLVFAFYFIRREAVHYSAKLLPISLGASLFALLTLLNAGGPARPVPDPALAAAPGRLAQKMIPRPAHTATIWDPAIIALYTDLKNSNDAYVAEVSRNDQAAQTLYRPESFRDAAAIQQALAHLHVRLAIAEKYSSVEPLVAKMDGYVAAVSAGDDEKREFLAGFMPGLRESVAYRTAASGYERDWLNASIALYEFMLAYRAAYTISADGQSATFRSAAPLKTFQQRLQKTYELKQRFLQANGAYLASQSALRLQAGMEQ